MEHVSTFFKEENDILYRIGAKDGFEKGAEEGAEKTKVKLVTNLLLQTDFTTAKVASLADVTEEFVMKVKKGLKNAKS